MNAASSRTGKVFSAYAEVFPLLGRLQEISRRFLRVRGGVSAARGAEKRQRRFSPRTRRCFSIYERDKVVEKVFSAYAEVFPILLNFFFLQRCFLRVRGGVSTAPRKTNVGARFSPRTRRCFSSRGTHPLSIRVFSAYAEVFPRRNWSNCCTKSFLRVRGGVSTSRPNMPRAVPFSPRTRRCFYCSVLPRSP